MTPTEFFESMRVFGEPDLPEGGEAEAVMNAYLRALGRYTPSTLQRAADMLLDNRKIRKFPLPSECTAACRDAQDELAAEAKHDNESRRSKFVSNDPWAPSRVKQADAMMDSATGRRAADEGWIVALHDFCREEGRLPNNFEAGKIRTAALGRKEERERRAAEFGGNPKILLSVTQALATRTARLTALARATEHA